MKLLDTTHKLFSKEDAIKIAAELSKDDDWEYRPVHCPKGTGLSFIEIYDEDGLVGRF
jgi:hypothetical protein